MQKGLTIATVIAVLLIIGYGFYTQYTYSEGNRAGLLIKFSRKGLMFKTYEGELNLGGVNTAPNAGLMNNMWAFSVANTGIADSLMHLEGKYVSVHYTQIMRNFPWQGETPYLVDGIASVK
jgi:hypothetical protein